MSDHGDNHQVVVYVLSKDIDCSTVATIVSYFDEPYFDVNRISIDLPSHLQGSKQITRKHAAEAYRFKWCLKHAQHEYPNKYIIIIKDTTISSYNLYEIKAFIKHAIDLNNAFQDSDAYDKVWDILYLCKWHDRCDLYDDKYTIKVETEYGEHGKLVKSHSPHGTQCVCFSPLACKKILNDDEYGVTSLDYYLNQKVEHNEYNAIVCDPNIFEYDPYLIRHKGDEIKGESCRRRPKHSNDTGDVNGIIVIIVIVIILIIIGLVRYR